MPARCTFFGRCGGCQSQDVPYADQLVRKQSALSGLLRQTLGPDAPPVRPVIGMPTGEDGHPWGFRQKASFSFGQDAGKNSFVIGHIAEHSRQVVPVTECPVHAPRANALAFSLAAHLRRARIPAAGPRLDGILRHVVIRTTRDEREAVVLLVVTRNDKRLRAPIRAFLDGPDAPSGFLLNVHDRPGPYMVGRETLTIAGRSAVKETALHAPYLVSPASFFQTNIDAARVLVDLVTAGVGSGAPQRVLDLYSGSGLFALPLAAAGHRVTAVEEHPQSVEDAHLNLRLSDAHGGRVRIVRSRVEDALRRLERDGADVVVLDPPRQGCPPAVIDGIFNGLAPARAIYVSCNPARLASELPMILDAGYAVEEVQPVDMFPHTPHIETVVVLRRTSATRARRH